MQRPLKDPSFATQEVAYTIPNPEGTGSSVVLSRVAIDDATRLVGIQPREPLPRPYYNEALYVHGEYIKYLNQGQVGDIHITSETTLTQADIEARFDGTWTDLGTETRFGITMRAFRKDV